MLKKNSTNADRAGGIEAVPLRPNFNFAIALHMMSVASILILTEVIDSPRCNAKYAVSQIMSKMSKFTHL
jgi:hypothetical protein